MPQRLHEVLRGWRARLAQPTDASSLAAFRVAFGPLVAYEMWYKLAAGKLAELHRPEFHFKYLYFEWVPEPLAWQARALIWAMVCLSGLVSLGLWFRPAALLLALGLSYYFTLEQTLYINHIYLYCLLAWVLACTRAHEKWSLDAYLGRLARHPSDGAGQAPHWNVWLLRFQMAVVYLYAGLAKLEPDWLSGRALELGLRARLVDSWIPVELLSRWMSWGGALFDLAIVPLLLHRRSRLAAFGLACAFHVTNASLFGLASFPWMCIALTSLFLDRSWPRRVLAWSSRMPGLAGLRRQPSASAHDRIDASGSATPPLPRPAALGLSAYLLFQALMPTRPWWYPGNANWTEEGHRFSWHMMLRGKRSSTRFFLQYPGHPRQPVDVRRYLTPRQLVKMSGDPEAIHQLARFLARRHARPDGEQPRVYVDALSSLNGHPRQRLIDPTVNLAAEPRGLAPARWILRE